MGACQSSFYGLTLVGARMDRIREGHKGLRASGRNSERNLRDAHITPVDGMIENIYSTFLSLSVMLETR